MKTKVKLLMVVILLTLSPLVAIIPSTASVKQDDVVTIGLFTPDTAGLGFYGTWVKQGFELGLEYATDDNVSGNYEIKYYDTKGLPTDAAALAISAIEDDGVDILVGGTYSSVAAALMPVAEQYKKLYFIVPGADASLTGSLFNKYCFRVARNSWHDAETFAYYATEYLNASKVAFLAADYSFGYSGVSTMSAALGRRGGTVVGIEYASLATTDFTPYINRLLTINAQIGIDVLMVVWAGSFSQMYSDFATADIFTNMTVSGAVIDIVSMNLVEMSLEPVGATLEGQRGLCLYGYELPDNPVNDWMVEQHVVQNIKPNAAFGYNYRVPELFTASAFGTAQFLVDTVQNVPDLDINKMITHLEGLNITTPKGPTYMRPQDHQGLAEMYIAECWNDTRPSSETYNQIIAKHVETIPAMEVAPPIETTYVPQEKPSEPGRTPGFELLAVFFAATVLVLSERKRKKQ